MVQPGQQRSMCAARERGFELWQAHHDEGGALWRPTVVHEDVQVPEHVGVEQVGLVEQEDGMDLVAAGDRGRGSLTARKRFAAVEVG